MQNADIIFNAHD